MSTDQKIVIVLAFLATIFGGISAYCDLQGWRERSVEAPDKLPSQKRNLWRRYGIPVFFLLLTWAAVAFNYYDRSGGIRLYTPATSCQLRLSPSERERILSFLRANESQRGRVKKIEIVVERERKDACLYAEDLRDIFYDKGLWALES